MNSAEAQTEIKPAKFFTWSDREGVIKQYGAKCLTAIPGFEIEVIPKFDNSRSTEEQNLYFESLVKQKSFLDTFFSVFISLEQQFSCGLELRLASKPAERRIRCYVLFKIMTVSTEDGTDDLYAEFDRLKSEFKRIFPKDYVIREVSEQVIEELLRFNPAHVVTEIIKSPKILTVGTISDVDEVEIADRYANDQNGQFKYHIPCCSYLEPKTYNFYNFYRLLMEIGFEAQVRIAVGAAEIFEVEKVIAAKYQGMILRSYSQTGNQEIQNYLSSFGKYLTANELYSLKIQVMCATEGQSLEVANSFCSQLSFGEINTMSHLKCFSLQGKPAEYIKSDWEGCNHYYYNLAGDKHQTDDIDAAPFIRRQTNLYDVAEVMAVFRLPVSDAKGVPGFIAKPVRPFYQPDLLDSGPGEETISLGTIERSIGDTNPLKYSLPIKNLSKHGLIVGSTGSGKTNTTLNFVKSLAEKDIPFLIIEPVKSEYYDELKEHFEKNGKKLNRFNFKRPFGKDGKRNPEFLRFNPLFPLNYTSSRTNDRNRITLSQHMGYIKGCFNAAFPMFGIMPMLLEECIYKLHLRTWDGEEQRFFDPDYTPRHVFDRPVNELTEQENYLRSNFNLEALVEEIDITFADETRYSSEDKTEFGNALRRRIDKLTKGVIGHALSPGLWVGDDEDNLVPDNIVKLLTEPTIIELEDLTDNEDKALVMAFLLTYLFELRQTEKPTRQLQQEQGNSFTYAKNTHVTIIEEAHRLLSSSNATGVSGGENATVSEDSRSKSISLFIDMLAEIRSKGQSIFIVEQIPTKLISDVIKNTNLKIMHRITSKDDRDYLGSAMNMNEQQKNYVPTLKTGEAVVFEEQLDHPVFIKMNKYGEQEEGK